MPPTGGLPALRNAPAEIKEQPFEVDKVTAPTAQELPDGSAQATFTFIPNENGDFDLYIHTAGINDEDGFIALIEAAQDSGVMPTF